jgi:xanthine dehydrogenase FAD-binding subunit
MSPSKSAALFFSTDPMAIYQHYHLPLTIQDALQIMVSAPAESRFIAGGTDLLLDLQQGRRRSVDTLVDVTRIPELTCVEIRDGRLFIGAAVPLNQIVASDFILRHAQGLNEAAGLIGGPQVRNSATLGGNVAHALPAADGTIALSALEAQAQIASLRGMRLVEMRDLFQGPGQSALDPKGEILAGFWIPLARSGEGSAFRRVMRPQGVALPILNMAIWLRRDGERVDDLRIALGPAGPVPKRALQAEQAIRGELLSPGLIQTGLDAILREAQFRSSAYRSGVEYRKHLTRILFHDTFQSAWGRAGENQTAPAF